MSLFDQNPWKEYLLMYSLDCKRMWYLLRRTFDLQILNTFEYLNIYVVANCLQMNTISLALLKWDVQIYQIYYIKIDLFLMELFNKIILFGRKVTWVTYQRNRNNTWDSSTDEQKLSNYMSLCYVTYVRYYEQKYVFSFDVKGTKQKQLFMSTGKV